MPNLSKSKIVAFRQCPKRLWLEVHRKDLREDSADSRAKFRVGHEVGALARRLYDPKGLGSLIDVEKDGFAAAFSRTRELLKRNAPVFEAGFSAGGVLAFADVMLKRTKKYGSAWDLIEVKSSTEVHDYHLEDVAIQTYALKSAGVEVRNVSLAYIDKTWVYPGNQDYAGLLKEKDLTGEAVSRQKDVAKWVKEAATVAANRTEPKIETGSHCKDPFECGFIDYCRSREPRVEYPVAWIPKMQTKALKERVAQPGVRDMRDVPDELLNPKQWRVKHHTIAGTVQFDRKQLKAALKGVSRPVYFLDFESVNLAIPAWKGMRPYQHVPFQFSLHVVGRDDRVRQHEFVDLSGGDPRRACAEALVSACGKRGAIFVYNATFESSRIKAFAEMFPNLRKALLGILDRIVDLAPLAEAHYYHPAQEGSWSLKAVIPTLVPELDYANLTGVADGDGAMTAYIEATHPETTATRKAEIEEQLRRYCSYDTLALVHLWARFSGEKKVPS